MVKRLKSKRIDAKKIAEIARKVNLRNVELKKAASSLTFTLPAGDTVIRCTNIFGNVILQQGTQDNQIVGTQCKVKSVDFRMNFIRRGNSSAAGLFNEPCWVRVAIIATDQLLTTTTATVAANDIYSIIGSPQYTLLGEIDKDKNSVSYDKIIDVSSKDVSRASATNDNSVSLIKKWNINRKIQYQGTPGISYLKNKNYYLVYHYGPAGLPNYVEANITWQVNFYDE